MTTEEIERLESLKRDAEEERQKFLAAGKANLAMNQKNRAAVQAACGLDPAAQDKLVLALSQDDSLAEWFHHKVRVARTHGRLTTDHEYPQACPLKLAEVQAG